MEDFNSHAHVERDISLDCHLEICVISTHTLTWSVTRGFRVARSQYIHFNSHAHVERDSGVEKVYKNNSYFNSHAHVERDNSAGGAHKFHKDFNSHAHVERDLHRTWR